MPTQPEPLIGPKPIDHRRLRCRVCGDGHVDRATGLCKACTEEAVAKATAQATIEPTTLQPGTAARVELYRERAAQGLPLNIEGDVSCLPDIGDRAWPTAEQWNRQEVMPTRVNVLEWELR